MQRTEHRTALRAPCRQFLFLVGSKPDLLRVPAILVEMRAPTFIQNTTAILDKSVRACRTDHHRSPLDDQIFPGKICTIYNSCCRGGSRTIGKSSQATTTVPGLDMYYYTLKFCTTPRNCRSIQDLLWMICSRSRSICATFEQR